jgi:hypothetical protein
VEGEAGVGKTVLWSAIVEHAHGVRVLSERPTAAEASAAYAALDDLVRPARSVLARMPEARRWALASALLLERTEQPPQPRAVALGLLCVQHLSPGTRGIVLLLLYLSIDQSDDRPLIMDQPEENLDPKSVSMNWSSDSDPRGCGVRSSS